MERYLDKREDQSVSSDSLFKLAKIILKHNYFELGQSNLGHCHWQDFVPHYANIFMARLEEEIFSNAEFQPLLWLRYLDGTLCL